MRINCRISEEVDQQSKVSIENKKSKCIYNTLSSNKKINKSIYSNISSYSCNEKQLQNQKNKSCRVLCDREIKNNVKITNSTIPEKNICKYSVEQVDLQGGQKSLEAFRFHKVDIGDFQQFDVKNVVLDESIR